MRRRSRVGVVVVGLGDNAWLEYGVLTTQRTGTRFGQVMQYCLLACAPRLEKRRGVFLHTTAIISTAC